MDWSMDWWALVVFVICCFAVRSLYLVTDVCFSIYAPYRSMPPHRQLYVQKNFVKSVVLCMLMIPAVVWVMIPMWSNQWHTETSHLFAAVYGSNDFVGLLMVRLPRTTRIHHVISTLLVVFSFSLDFETSPVAQSMLVYTFFAASAYLVNLQLALRWFPDTRLRVWAGRVYVVACVLSWTWQVAWLWRTTLALHHWLYVLLMLWIVRDDVILMRWLQTARD